MTAPPDRPESDTDEAWGDRAAADDDQLDEATRRLLAERPPHYGGD